MNRQRGTALLTVLLLVALVGALVLGGVHRVRFGVRAAGNAQAVAQARWHALGALALAGQRLQDLHAQGAALPADATPLLLPVEDGSVAVRLRPAATCFNLNSVVQGAGEQWQRSEAGVARYRALLEALGEGGDRSQALADALVDWIDSDQARSPAGAEDRDYADRRTGGTLLAEPSELRAIRGYDAPVYARLRPFACALDGAAALPVDVNALTPDQAPLVQMLAGNAIDAATAARTIQARPSSGWRDVAAFWSTPGLARVDPALRGEATVRGTLFALDAEVTQADALVEMHALLRLDAAGRARVLVRRWSPAG